jgi:hypothetical protein
MSVLNDAHLIIMNVNALRLSHEFANLIREGYSQDSLRRSKLTRLDLLNSIAMEGGDKTCQSFFCSSAIHC